MRRATFLTMAAAPLLFPRAVRAQADVDPATSSARPALRVLLGAGDASPATPGTFSFAGRLYRGSFARLANGQILNTVDLEEYLYSVVPTEMPSGWRATALAAQAICARTYVLQRSDPRRDYDLVPSELDQVYRGMQSESPAATAAVDATAGRVLRYGEAFAHVAYSSCCGGHTEGAADAWGSLSMPYLAGVVCTSCTASPNYRWSVSFTLDDIAAPFANSLAGLGDLQDLEILGRDSSGRVRAFGLRARGGSITVQGGAFRRAVGARALRSLLITSLQRSPDGQTLAMQGGGLGHGVGLCQWGARGMADGGATAQSILAYYLPGTFLSGLSS
jgi:stage II sporulation protein D